MPDPKLLKWMEDLMLSTSSSSQLLLPPAPKKDPQHLQFPFYLRAMNWTPNQTSQIGITPLSLYLWWCWKGKALCCPCWVKFQSPQSRGRGCILLQIQTAIAALCYGATKMGPQAYEFNPICQIDSLSDTACLILKWDCNYSWSKIYNGHWFCSMKCLQEMSTDLLTRLKINWTVFRFFGMKSESSRCPSQINNLVCFGFLSLNPLFISDFESFIHCFFYNPLAVSSSTTCPSLSQFSLLWSFQNLLSSRKDAAFRIKRIFIFGIEIKHIITSK